MFAAGVSCATPAEANNPTSTHRAKESSRSVILAGEVATSPWCHEPATFGREWPATGCRTGVGSRLGTQPAGYNGAVLDTLARCIVTTVAMGLVLTPFGCDQGDGGDAGTTTMENVSPCEGEDRDDAFAVGLSKTGNKVTVEFVDAMPAPPRKGDNTWHLKLTDESGAATEGASLQIVPWMPDHGHGTPIDATVENVADAPGEYMADPVNMHMAGLWEVTVEMTLPDDTTDSVMFSFCIDP